MGNKKNRNKKSKTKANNWRGIIRMRKPKNVQRKNVRINNGGEEGQLNVHTPCSVDINNIDMISSVILEEGNEVYGNAIQDVLQIPHFEDQPNVAIIHSIEFLDNCLFVINNAGDLTIDPSQVNLSEDQPNELINTHHRSDVNEIAVTNDLDEVETSSLISIIECGELSDYDEMDDNDLGTEVSNENVTSMPENQPNESMNIPNSVMGEISDENIQSETQSTIGFDILNGQNNDKGTQSQENLKNCAADDPAKQDEDELSGHRIIDMKNFFEQLQQLSNHSGFCHFEDMIFTREVRKGLLSTFEFHCTVCGHESCIYSCNYQAPVNLNHAAVLGITGVGLGSYHLNEICSYMEIPCMTDYMYNATQTKQQLDWWKLAQQEASKALKEEIRLAILLGDVDSNGNVLIVVIVDGSWPKRSYHTNFTSLSGCAVIIGHRTNKVIYFDVKDKYCHVCQIAKSRKVEPREHECNTNYVGPSSSMETTIVIEGFQACEKLGVRFKEYIADGDSSTHKNVCDLNIYENPAMSVEKDDCCNHLHRNYRSAFGGLAKATKKFKLSTRKHLTKKKGNDICLGVQSAAKHWRTANVDTVEKLINLEKDVLNAPLHVFGIHDECAEYFCSKTTEPEARSVIDMLKSDGVWDEILHLSLKYFASSVPSLLLNYNNNWAESFNNLVAKFTGGKRINYCLGKSYRMRVARAVVQYNSGSHSGSSYLEFKGYTDNKLLKELENRRKRKVQKNASVKAGKPKKARYAEQKADKADDAVAYGEGCQTIDKPKHLLEIKKAQFLEARREDQKNRDFINNATLGKMLNRKFRDMRINLLTSFYFSRIINARSPKSYTALCEDIIHKKTELSNTAELRHQKIYEEKALRCFSLKHKADYISECGLLIDMEHCFLASSPFKLYADDAIICIKCPLVPYKKRVKTIDEAIDKNLIPFWKKVKGVVTVNKASAWYIQIQGELHIACKSLAYLVIWLESEFQIEKVYRDDDFWTDTMEKPLVYFYEEVMLKELLDPRSGRHMKQRVYNSKTNTFE